MIYNNDVRNLLKSSDSVTSDHTVLAEWNMNRYQKIASAGVYIGEAANLGTGLETSKIYSGKTKVIFEDETFLEPEDAQYFSNIESVFQADRPDPGIVLLQYYDEILISEKASDLSLSNYNPNNPRFYPFSKNRKYDYFISSKPLKAPTGNETAGQFVGKSTTIGGAISNANPFVIYETPFPCNKITIKVQNHNSVPDGYAIEILDPDTNQWVVIFRDSNAVTNPFGALQGVLEIYYDGDSTWTTTPQYLTDLTQLENPSTQLKKIKGIRFKVTSMETVTIKGQNYSVPLELIEISPRIHADLSSFTESFSFNSSLGDSEFGLPVGKIVASTGEVQLSNGTKAFLLSSSAAALNLLTPDVEFKFYQNVYANSTTHQIPLKTMYSEEWSLNSDFTVAVSLSDRLRLFQEKNVSDMCLVSNGGIPLSVIILMVLDNAGITGYEFKKALNDTRSQEDTKIESFFCRKEQTVAEVLEKLAIATQCGMFFDANGNLNVLTKERITRSVSMDDSTSSNNGTDWWLVFDEEYPVSGQEQPSISSYSSNVISSQESRIDPVTDGNIIYKTYGVMRQPAQNLLNLELPKELTSDLQLTLLTNIGYAPSLDILWSAGQTKSSVLGAATLISNISSQRVEQAYPDSLNDFVNESAVINSMATSNNFTAAQKRSLVIKLDNNGMVTFGEFSGYIMVDSEYIAYNGILYSINGVEKVIFSKEQLQEEISNLPARFSSVIPIGLIVDVRFNATARSDGGYNYKVISSGRGQLGSEVVEHEAINASTMVPPSGKEAVALGGAVGTQGSINQFEVTTQYDYSDIKNFAQIKRALGIRSDYRSDLGLLKISGPPSPQEDIRAINSASAATLMERINRNVDGLVGESMAPYVYTQGERFIYMQEIKELDGSSLNITPHLIATRFKLYSGRTEEKNGQAKYSTNSSIAGIAFGIRKDGSGNIIDGYFLEVESVGSAAQDFIDSKQTLKQNLRFYKIGVVQNKIIATVLATATAPVVTSITQTTDSIQADNESTEQIFNLEVRVDFNKSNGIVQFYLYYNDQLINFNKPVIDRRATSWTQSKNVYVFVRNDSQAIFEYIILAQKPANLPSANRYFTKTRKSLIEGDINDSVLLRGGIDRSYYDLFRNKSINYRYFDFARTVREVKKYTPRYEKPAVTYKLIDISAVNPEYMIQRSEFSTYGAEIIVVNASRHPVTLRDDSNSPLYIFGANVQELTTGRRTLKDFYESIEDDNKKITNLAFNKSVYGEKTFELSSDFIQTDEQVRSLFRWINRCCTRQRLQMSMEIYANPLLEPGDKVKVYSKDRGYNMANPMFGIKTFVITDISHEVSSGNKKMNITVVEVGDTSG